MRRLSPLFLAAPWLAVGLLAGCSAPSTSSPVSTIPNVGSAPARATHGRFVPQWSEFASVVPPELRARGDGALHGRPMPPRGRRAAQGGIYGSQFFSATINGYHHRNTGNGPPVCSLGASYPNGIAVDNKGNLIVPDGGTRSIIVYQGPGMCGPEVGSVSDPFGQPSDAASADAVDGTIVVSNIFGNVDRSQGAPHHDTTSNGNISLCTLASGCTVDLINPAIYEAAGVALANNGDCWASAIDSSGFAILVYFAGCSGDGQLATGFENAYWGGLDIDKSGNIVSVDLGVSGSSSLWVYRGCNPACSLVGGPFPLLGQSVFGHLNKQSMAFVAGDVEFGQLDVYDYSPTSLTYSYSINNGFAPSEDVEGAAYNPRSQQ